MADARHADTAARAADPGAEAGHPAPARRHVPLRALWFGVFAAPAAWSVQTLVNFTLAAHACYPGLYPLATPTVGALRGIVFAVSLATIAVCIAATAVSWRTWRRTRAEAQQDTGSGAEHGDVQALLETGAGRTRFMAMGGLLMSGVFLVASIVHLASLFLVTPCGAW